MNERYTRLFSLPEHLHAPGAPVVIAAGALLLDNQTGRVLAQLKIQNIGPKVIKAVTVLLSPLDTVGQSLGEPVRHQYLDLSAGRDQEFGQQVPVFFPDATTRGYAARVQEVAFVDNTLWTAEEDAAWTPLPAPVPLERALGDAELAHQFRIQYGKACLYQYLPQDDVWRCACGALNQQEEETCHKCGASAAALRSPDLPALQQGRDVRLARAREQAAQAQAAAQTAAMAQQAAAAAKKQKNKRLALILVPIAAVILAAAVALFLWTRGDDGPDRQPGAPAETATGGESSPSGETAGEAPSGAASDDEPASGSAADVGEDPELVTAVEALLAELFLTDEIDDSVFYCIDSDSLVAVRILLPESTGLAYDYDTLEAYYEELLAVLEEELGMDHLLEIIYYADDRGGTDAWEQVRDTVIAQGFTLLEG